MPNRGPTSLDIYALNHFLVEEGSSDPEDSLMFALTRREVALCMFATLVLGRLFPELTEHCSSFYDKIEELGVAQGYIERFRPEE